MVTHSQRIAAEVEAARLPDSFEPEQGDFSEPGYNPANILAFWDRIERDKRGLDMRQQSLAAYPRKRKTALERARIKEMELVQCSYKVAMPTQRAVGIKIIMKHYSRHVNDPRFLCELYYEDRPAPWGGVVSWLVASIVRLP